jgi:hypothetical protein
MKIFIIFSLFLSLCSANALESMEDGATHVSHVQDTSGASSLKIPGLTPLQIQSYSLDDKKPLPFFPPSPEAIRVYISTANYYTPITKDKFATLNLSPKKFESWQLIKKKKELQNPTNQTANLFVVNIFLQLTNTQGDPFSLDLGFVKYGHLSETSAPDASEPVVFSSRQKLQECCGFDWLEKFYDQKHKTFDPDIFQKSLLTLFEHATELKKTSKDKLKKMQQSMLDYTTRTFNELFHHSEQVWAQVMLLYPEFFSSMLNDFLQTSDSKILDTAQWQVNEIIFMGTTIRDVCTNCGLSLVSACDLLKEKFNESIVKHGFKVSQGLKICHLARSVQSTKGTPAYVKQEDKCTPSPDMVNMIIDKLIIMQLRDPETFLSPVGTKDVQGSEQKLTQPKRSRGKALKGDQSPKGKNQRPNPFLSSTGLPKTKKCLFPS